MYKVGDKVVPIDQEKLKNSFIWNKAKEIGQKYLYVLMVVDNMSFCSDVMGDIEFSRGFLENELIKYKSILEDEI